MITLRADTHNKKVLLTITKATSRWKAGIRGALATIGKENSRHTKRLINKSSDKTGRTYRIQGRTHRASAPFEAPATLYGKLQRSVKFKVYGSEKMEFGDTVFYGKYLEQGTKNKEGRVRMKPRPHLKTTVREKQKDNFLSLLTFVDREVKKP